MDIQQSLKPFLERDPKLAFRFDPKLGVINQLRGDLGKTRPNPKGLQAAGLDLIRAHKDLFGDIDFGRIEQIVENKDCNGGLSLTLQQYHGKLRVLDGSVRFHADRKGKLDSVNNRLFPDLEALPKEAKIGEAEAVKRAKKKCSAEGEPLQQPELLVHRYHGCVRLAWHIQLQGSKPGLHGADSQWVIFVDASDGDVYFFYDNIQTAGPTVGSGTGYYSGAGALNAWDDDVTNRLRDTTRSGMGGPEITTNDDDGTSPSSDGDNNWNDLSSSPRDQNQGAEVDAHRFAAVVNDYFNTVHGRNSYDGVGANLVINVHVGNNFNNGYWSPTAQNVSLGDGDGVGWDYMCSDDWLAHEFTHAYTQFTCGLIYNGESGALNEAFSDIFAAFITGDWLVFEDSWLSATAPAARNMIEPTNGGQWDNSSEAAVQASTFAGHQPSHYNQRYTGTWDNSGVHINSGIINHLFYLLTIGGTHTISGITVSGIGQSAAEQMLWRCMSVNLVGNSNATFLEFREALLDACQDLFATDLNFLTQVKNAFNAVGIGPDHFVRDNTSDSGTEPYTGTYLWASPDVINRQSLSANPALDFADLSNGSLWQNIEAGQDNHVYIRAQNRGNEIGDTTINVYFSSATTFGTPASWTHIGTLLEAGIAPGAVRIAGPLTFPQAMIPAPGHYCMIAVLSSSVDPAPDHTLIASVTDYLHFVRSSNNISYRNMDVVNLVPGTPGVAKAIARPMPGLRERFNLRLDAGQFVPGARLRIRGPAKPLDGAIVRGMKLIARDCDHNVYEVMPARELQKQHMFRQEMQHVIGFDQVLIERDFEVQAEWVLPKDPIALRRAPQEGYRIGWRQSWQGEDVGAAYINLRRAKDVADDHPCDDGNGADKPKRKKAVVKH